MVSQEDIELVTREWRNKVERLQSVLCERGRLAWVVENGKSQGNGLKYLRFNHNSGAFEWTPDVYLALQLSRRLDAEEIAFECEDAWKIVEHHFANSPC